VVAPLWVDSEDGTEVVMVEVEVDGAPTDAEDPPMGMMTGVVPLALDEAVGDSTVEVSVEVVVDPLWLCAEDDSVEIGPPG